MLRVHEASETERGGEDLGWKLDLVNRTPRQVDPAKPLRGAAVGVPVVSPVDEAGPIPRRIPYEAGRVEVAARVYELPPTPCFLYEDLGENRIEVAGPWWAKRTTGGAS